MLLRIVWTNAVLSGLDYSLMERPGSPEITHETLNWTRGSKYFHKCFETKSSIFIIPPIQTPLIRHSYRPLLSSDRDAVFASDVELMDQQEINILPAHRTQICSLESTRPDSLLWDPQVRRLGCRADRKSMGSSWRYYSHVVLDQEAVVSHFRSVSWVRDLNDVVGHVDGSDDLCSISYRVFRYRFQALLWVTAILQKMMMIVQKWYKQAELDLPILYLRKVISQSAKFQLRSHMLEIFRQPSKPAN